MPESPCLRVLKKKTSYGSLLLDFISNSGITPRHILEIGGGYGFLARDFLKDNPHLQVTLWDISPSLLKKQKDTLRGFQACVLEKDILDADPTTLAHFDLIIMNEMIGDLPTLTDLELTGNQAPNDGATTFFWEEAKRVISAYNLEIPSHPFNFNIGAILALETVLSSRVENIFISEHSCEATVPEEMKGLIFVSAPNHPEPILLKGHREFTIKFSHLEAVAQSFSYHIKRGPLADFIPLDMSDRLKVCLRASVPRTGEEEAIRQFVSDLYQYEYLLLTKGHGS
ncbi:MAG: class I SAM-dependent methyltransferase [Syntrophales bacterium]|nr:class I SAM-dependent methyltransferase [Syntrophales bacterium]